MCKDNFILWALLLLAILFSCNSDKDNSSTPLGFDTFFELESP